MGVHGIVIGIKPEQSMFNFSTGDFSDVITCILPCLFQCFVQHFWEFLWSGRDGMPIIIIFLYKEENTSCRRPPLSSYMCMEAIYGLFYSLKSKGYVKSFPNGEVSKWKSAFIQEFIIYKLSLQRLSRHIKLYHYDRF